MKKILSNRYRGIGKPRDSDYDWVGRGRKEGSKNKPKMKIVVSPKTVKVRKSIFLRFFHQIKNIMTP